MGMDIPYAINFETRQSNQQKHSNEFDKDAASSEPDVPGEHPVLAREDNQSYDVKEESNKNDATAKFADTTYPSLMDGNVKGWE